MLKDWNYNMSIGDVLDILENTSFSKQQYKDLILSYHIQRLNENYNRQQQSVTSLPQRIQKEITTYRSIFSNQFQNTQDMFEQIQEQNIPNLNECMKNITSQLENLAESTSASVNYSLFDKTEKFEKFEKYDSTISGTSDVQSEWSKLQIFFEQYNKRFQELTQKLKIHKDKFTDERKKNISQEEQLLRNILEITNQQE